MLREDAQRGSFGKTAKRHESTHIDLFHLFPALFHIFLLSRSGLQSCQFFFYSLESIEVRSDLHISFIQLIVSRRRGSLFLYPVGVAPLKRVRAHWPLLFLVGGNRGISPMRLRNQTTEMSISSGFLDSPSKTTTHKT